MHLAHARGALLGLAVGDALGTTLEFTSPRLPPFPTLLDGPHREVIGGGPFELAPGQVTDDTHMACCLAASLSERGGFDAADVSRRYVAWREHTFDIGHTTRTAVELLARDDLEAGRKVWEASGRRAAANGSLMRTAPIGVYFWSDPARRRAAALADSALTHFDPRCQLACAALNAAIAGAIGEGEGSEPIRAVALAEEEVQAAAAELLAREPALAEVIKVSEDELLADLRLARQDDPELENLIHRAAGFVRVAFRLAFWELLHAPSFQAGLIDCVNRGGDADTNGAIAGALLAALYGEGAIPPAWTDRVLGALHGDSPGPLRDDYHPKVLLRMLESLAGTSGRA